MTRGEILSDRIKLMAMRLVEAEGPDLEVIQNENAVRRMGTSAATVLRRHERRFCTLEALLAEGIRLEKQHPLALEDEQQWYCDLLETTMLVIRDQQKRMYEALEADSIPRSRT